MLVAICTTYHAYTIRSHARLNDVETRFIREDVLSLPTR